MLCLQCNTNEATKHELYGWLPCLACQGKPSVERSESVEFITDSIKTQRKEFGKDIIQPHRKGELSKEYVDAYGAQAALDKGFTREEVKKVRNVWDGYYK